MNKTTFSVVVPTYNRAEYIGELLDCLVKQTYKGFEVLICDDGSIDNTSEVVEKYKLKLDIKYLYDNNWGGPAKPRNTGINNAVGEWICFLDSDDLWYEDKLAEVKKVINDKVDLIYHLFTTNLNDDKTIGFYQKSFAVNQFEDLLYNGNKIVNSSMVIRRSLLLDIHGLDEDKKLIGVEDYDLTIRLAQINAKFLLLNKILGEYRLNDTNISADYFKQLDKLTYLLSRYESSVSNSGKLKMSALINYLSGSYYLRNEQIMTGKKKLWTSFLYGSFQIKMKSFIKILTSF